MTDDPGGGTLQITPERVRSLAGQIGEATAEFSNRLRGVDDEIRHLLGAGWKGEPGSQFHDEFVEWHHGASDVVAGMNQLVQALQDAAHAFRSADQPR